MNPALIFLISESIKLLFQHLSQRGSLDSLTQTQAEAQVKAFADALPTLLPAPEDLEGPGTPITQ